MIQILLQMYFYKLINFFKLSYNYKLINFLDLPCLPK